MGWGLNKGSARFVTDDAGQSLIEVALTLPLLLMLLLGLVDGARAYSYAGIVANSAREGAVYAARNGTATQAEVTQRVCDSTGMVAFGSACPGLAVTCAFANGDATVEVLYDFSLITASVVDAAFKLNPLRIHAAARFPAMTSGTPCAT